MKVENWHPAYEDLHQILTAGFPRRREFGSIKIFDIQPPATPLKKRQVDLKRMVEDGLRLLRSGAPVNVLDRNGRSKSGIGNSSLTESTAACPSLKPFARMRFTRIAGGMAGRGHN